MGAGYETMTIATGRNLQVVSHLEALMHSVAGLARLDGVADDVHFGNEGLQFLGMVSSHDIPKCFFDMQISAF